jgi:hypothetical protein
MPRSRAFYCSISSLKGVGSHQLFLDFARRWHKYELGRLPQVVVIAILIGILLVGVLRAEALQGEDRGTPRRPLAQLGCIDIFTFHTAVDLVQWKDGCWSL